MVLPPWNCQVIRESQPHGVGTMKQVMREPQPHGTAIMRQSVLLSLFCCFFKLSPSFICVVSDFCLCCFSILSVIISFVIVVFTFSSNCLVYLLCSLSPKIVSWCFLCCFSLFSRFFFQTVSWLSLCCLWMLLLLYHECSSLFFFVLSLCVVYSLLQTVLSYVGVVFYVFVCFSSNSPLGLFVFDSEC